MKNNFICPECGYKMIEESNSKRLYCMACGNKKEKREEVEATK